MTAAMHPAIILAQGIYDAKGDLASYQQVFLTAVHKIRGANTRSKETAIELFGRGSKTYLASAHLSDRQESCDLTKAMAAYDEALEIA